jgi:CubicO group peptidase (beta-lactamase class C family)
VTILGHHRARVALFGMIMLVASCATEVAPSLAPSTRETVEYGDYPTLPTTALPPAATGAMQNVLDKAIDAGTASAIAAAVIVPGVGSWAGAAGEGLDGEPLPVDAQFFIASITKTVVAAQVMHLAEQDRVDLDALLADYLPPDVAIDTNGATVRQALAMRSGLARDLSSDIIEPIEDAPDREWTLRDLADYVEEPVFQPGQVFQYANLNYTLLGAAIEFVTEQPLAEVLRTGVLAHPGLDRLIYQDAERPQGSLAPPTWEGIPSARAAIEAGGGYLPSRAVVTAMGGAASMVSDAASLARWAYLLYGGYVLEPSSLTEMIDTGNRYGLGTWPVEQNGLHGIGHDGWLAGYRSLAYADRETGTVIVVLVNAETHSPVATAAQLLRIVGH